MNDHDPHLIRRLIDDGYVEVAKDDPLYVKIKNMFRVDEYDEELDHFLRIDLNELEDEYFHSVWNTLVFLYDPKRMIDCGQ